MDNLRRFIKEDAAGGAVSTGAVAANPWGGSPSCTKKKTKKTKLPVTIRRSAPKTIRSESFIQSLLEFDVDPDFDPADVVSRLKSTEKKSTMDNRDTVTFGLEDANGNVVKIYVRNDQAPNFEKSLQQILQGDQDTEEFDSKAGRSPEVAEVLYNLKDKYDIIDVVWPDSEEEEEAAGTRGVQAQQGEEGGNMENDLTLDNSGEEGGEEEVGDILGGEEGDMLGGEEDDMLSGGGEETALQQMIKMMQSKAEADKAEAEAKKAEAEADKAKYIAQAAEAKLKQEEQVLDMEAYYKNKKTMDDETKQLAKLAKWKHDMVQDVEGDNLGFASEEEEENVVHDIGKETMVPQAKPVAQLSTAEAIDELYKRLRVQN